MSQPAEKFNFEGISVSGAAKQALEQCAGDWKKAADTLLGWANSNDVLYRELAESMIQRAAWDAIKRAAHSTRSAFKASAVRSGKDSAQGISAVAQTNFNDWLNYPLRGGVKLGDATRSELTEEIEWHNTLAQANAQRARWYQRIAEKVGDKKVRDVLENDDIEQIYKETTHV